MFRMIKLLFVISLLSSPVFASDYSEEDPFDSFSYDENDSSDVERAEEEIIFDRYGTNYVYVVGRYVLESVNNEKIFLYDPFEDKLIKDQACIKFDNSLIRIGNRINTIFGPQLSLYALGFSDDMEDYLSENDIELGSALLVKIKLAKDLEESEVVEILHQAN